MVLNWIHCVWILKMRIKMLSGSIKVILIFKSYDILTSVQNISWKKLFLLERRVWIKIQRLAIWLRLKILTFDTLNLLIQFVIIHLIFICYFGLLFLNSQQLIDNCFDAFGLICLSLLVLVQFWRISKKRMEPIFNHMFGPLPL